MSPEIGESRQEQRFRRLRWPAEHFLVEAADRRVGLRYVVVYCPFERSK